MTLAALKWPVARLGDALVALARSARLGDGAPPPVAQGLVEDARPELLLRWLDAASAALGFEVEPVVSPAADLDAVLERAGPALLWAGDGFLALAGGGRAELTLLGPRDERQRHAVSEVRDALLGPAPADVEALLDAARLEGKPRSRARSALTRELAGARRISGLYLLRATPGAPMGRLLSAAGVTRGAAAFLALLIGYEAAFIGSWWLLGQGALSGRLDRGWLAAWALLLVLGTVLRLFALRAQGRAAIGASAVLKARLLAGALRLEADEVRHEGVGRYLGRVLDAQAVEQLALGGGSLAIIAAVELVAAPLVLATGAGSGALLATYIAFATLGLVGARLYWRRRRAATDAGLALTHELIERLVGHRTRLVQEPRSEWHEGLDHAVSRTLDTARDVDRATSRLMVLTPRGWLLAALVALVPAFVGGAPLAALAVSIAGILLGQRALKDLAEALAQLAAAAIAWRKVAPLVAAAARPRPAGTPALALAAPAHDGPLLEVRDVTYRHHGRATPALAGVDLNIAAGERLLLEGPSGGGKSTLSSLLVGLRNPERGLILLGGLDRASLGDDGWRRHVVAAPQFHENHVFADTLGFNLLMGRGWPPSTQDFADAEAMCQALGLGPLLTKMPAGLMQIVGEMGWQLSHGERSRVYIARALLGGAELVILDESFAALDPETLTSTLAAVEGRAKTLLVVAHP